MTLIRAGRIPADAGLDPAWDAQRAVNRWHSALEKCRRAAKSAGRWAAGSG
jgi:hypothetical protein